MNNKILNIAHKGASESYPENTLLAFEKAIETGSDMLELDLRLSRDKQVVAFHDERISLKEENCINNAVLGVSNPKLIEKARSLNGNLAVSLLVGLDELDKIFDLGREYKPDYLHPCWEKYSKTPSSLLTEEFFDNVKECNFRIVTWHEENEDELEKLSALPVYGIRTDNPGLLSKILKRM